MLAGISLPDRYEPIRRIARGGMATVWCAQDRTLARRVAIKLLAEPFAYDELAGRRFKREARAAARLSGHPNVVTIYDVGEAPSDDGNVGRPFLVMEYLAGGTAADALRTGNVDPVTALLWLHQAGAALDYAHRRGVIHRDVKLANFLLDRDRVLHVADFGIAQLGTEDTLTVSGEVLGTAAYLAPERALGQPATDASDRYALAVAAFELLVGERPFTAEHFAAQARQHLEEPPPLASRRNPELPAALDAALVRGMAKHPEDRFATSAALTDAIEDALALSPSPCAAAATAVTRPLRPVARAARPVATTGGARSGAHSAPRASSAARASTRPPARPTVPRPTRARIAALSALAAVLLGVAIAAAVGGRAGRPAHAVLASHRIAHRSTASHRATKPKGSTTTRSSAATTPAPSVPAPGSTRTADATALEAQGHALMVSGAYRSAIPVLRHAVEAASPSSLTYAYALFDLGRSLRLAGDPRAAVPILWRRLQIPNQTPVVQAELALALEALGQQASPPHDHHGGDQGGPPSGGQGD